MISRREIEIIGYDCGWGCQDYGCENGPEYLLKDELEDNLKQLGYNVIWHDDLHIKDMGNRTHMDSRKDTLPLVIEASKRLSSAVQIAIRNNRVPIVIGGDHTAAIGTWSGIISALDIFRQFGLIWIDAHMDAHTPDTAHQGKWGGWWHGMPVACLTGEGIYELTSIASHKAKIDMQNFALLGARSYEDGEEKFMQKHNAKIYKMPEINEKGFDLTFKDAIKIATGSTKGFGISIDLDGIDPKDAPGVGTEECGGIKAVDLIKSVTGIAKHPLFRGLEIVEYNPHNDKQQKTTKLINKLILAMLN